MADNSRIFAAIEAQADPDKLRALMANAKRKSVADVYDAAFRRLAEIASEDEPGALDHDFWGHVAAMEQVALEHHGKAVRMTGTRQVVRKNGVAVALGKLVSGKDAADGFKQLADRNMPELTAEAIVLRHSADFAPEVVTVARARLVRAGLDPAAYAAA